MRSVEGFVLFAADRPLVGLDPHPAFAPNPPAELTAKGWADAYLENEAAEDHEAEVNGSAHPNDCVDPDVPLAVRVFANGDMEVFADAARAEWLACYTKADLLFGAFATAAPVPEPP